MLKRMLMATGLVLTAAALLIGCNTGSRSGADGSFPGLPTAALPTSIGTITGLVTDANALPINGATITLYSNSNLVSSANTGSDGKFIISAAPGTYELHISKSGFVNSIQAVTIEAGRAVSVVAPLAPASPTPLARVQGIISDLTGRPQEGALVRLVSSSSDQSTEFTTLADGRFSFSHTPGLYQLHVSKPNFVPEVATITLVVGQELIKDMVIGPKSTIRGAVKLHTTKEPLANILVEVFRQGEFKGSMETTSSGEFTFQDLTPGTYQVRVANQSTAYSPATYTVQILNDGTISPSNPEFFISPRLVAPTDVRHPLATGTIYDAYTKAPLENVNCTLKGVKAVTTDMHGRFYFADLLPGNYEMTFSKLGWQTLTVTFSITESNGATALRPSPLTYELIQNKETGVGAIAGRFIDENALTGVNNLIVRVYTYRLVEKTISVLASDTLNPKTVSNWELDGGPIPRYILSTKTGVAGSGYESALGTFRLEHLQPTTPTMKYLVWVGTAAIPSPTMTSVAHTEAVDRSTPKVVWYQENVADPNRVHSWSMVDVYPDTTTFLQNFNLPNN